MLWLTKTLFVLVTLHYLQWRWRLTVWQPEIPALHKGGEELLRKIISCKCHKPWILSTALMSLGFPASQSNSLFNVAFHLPDPALWGSTCPFQMFSRSFDYCSALVLKQRALKVPHPHPPNWPCDCSHVAQPEKPRSWYYNPATMETSVTLHLNSFFT